MRALLLTFAALPLVGCSMEEAPQPLPSPPAAEPGQPPAACNADPIQSYLGSVASEEAAADMIAKSGASIFQWVPPRTAVTMDYRIERLRVSYDDNRIITRIACG